MLLKESGNLPVAIVRPSIGELIKQEKGVAFPRIAGYFLVLYWEKRADGALEGLLQL